jgi:GNAT superfamily N-acetyltransferase
MATTKSKYVFKPATAHRWADVEKLFGARGACGGCWCMAWRLSRSDFQSGKGDGNRRRLKKLMQRERAPGILAYAGGEVAGWCSVAPREEFSFLERSRVLKPLDGKPVWSVSCLFVAKPHRSNGLSVELLRAAADYARSQGAKIVEGYPTEAKSKQPDVFVWTGLLNGFVKAGYKEAGRHSKVRPIVRKVVAR